MVGDKCIGLVEPIREVYPKTRYQRCMVHFMRNILNEVPRNKVQLDAAARIDEVIANCEHLKTDKRME